MRLNPPRIDSATTRAAVVFARPGTLSMSRWPPARRPSSMDSRRWFCPTTFAENAPATALTMRWASAKSRWSSCDRAAVMCPSVGVPIHLRCTPTCRIHARTRRSRRFGDVMLALLLPLLGFALLDSLNVLNLGVTTAVVYDSRLGRRSALPSGLSFVGGVFTAITTFGILTVLGLNFLTDRFDFDLTPPLRYWGQ